MSHAFVHQIFISHVRGLLLEIRAYEQRQGMGTVVHTCGPSLRRLRQGELKLEARLGYKKKNLF